MKNTLIEEIRREYDFVTDMSLRMGKYYFKRSDEIKEDLLERLRSFGCKYLLDLVIHLDLCPGSFMSQWFKTYSNKEGDLEFWEKFSFLIDKGKCEESCKYFYQYANLCDIYHLGIIRWKIRKLNMIIQLFNIS